jgi:hypothetical protein
MREGAMPKRSKRSFFFKLRILFLISLLLLAINTYYYADYQTTLKPGVYIGNGSSDLTANNWSVPLVYDWNGDRKKDLLVGQNYIDENNTNHGYVGFYENAGTDAAPYFNGVTYLQKCSNKCSRINVDAFG